MARGTVEGDNIWAIVPIDMLQMVQIYGTAAVDRWPRAVNLAPVGRKHTWHTWPRRHRVYGMACSSEANAVEGKDTFMENLYI